MSVKLYDDALLQKLKNWTEKTSVHVYGVQESEDLFRINADEEKDTPAKLPILCLRRNFGYTVTNANKQPMTFDGISTNTPDSESCVTINAIPISISYQLDIYTRYLEEADMYARNLVFNFINYPTLQIQFEYNGSTMVHNANVFLSNDIVDNTSSTERLFDQFSRLTLMLTIDDAYLWDLRVRSYIGIDCDDSQLQIVDSDNTIIKENF